MSDGIMSRDCRTRTATVLCVVCLLTSGAYAQSRQQYGLSWNIRIAGGGYLGTPPRTWLLYREDMAEVEIAINLDNTGQDALYFNSGIIERSIRVRLFSMDETSGELQERPVRMSMRGILEQDGSGPFITVPDHLVLTEGQNGIVEGRRNMVVWIVAATKPDGGPFTPGRYRFDIEVRDIPSAIVTATGGPLPANALPYFWYGVSRGDVGLVIAAPSTPAETAAMHVQRGDLAFERRQFDEAVAWFRRAVAAAPSDAGTALQRLGGMYLAMGRHAEAVPVLERLPIRGPGLLESLLAEAYVGAGNEADAMSLLQRSGRSQAEVVAEIERLRERVRQHPAR